MASNKFKIIKIETVKNDKTEIYKIINKKIKNFQIKELYLNNVKKEKNWIYHKKNKVLFFPLQGNFFFTLFYNKKYTKLNINTKNKHLLIINSKTWFKILVKKNQKNLLLCAQNYYHDKNEFKKHQKI